MRDKKKTEEKSAAAAVVDIYEANKVKLFSSYKEFVSRAREQLVSEAKATVLIRWSLGAHVKATLDDARYGEYRVDDLERDLGLSRSMLYFCKALFEEFDRTSIESVGRSAVPLRALSMLLKLQDKSERARYIKQLGEGSINSESLPRMLKADAGEKGGASPKDTAGVAEEEPEELAPIWKARRAYGKLEGYLDLADREMASFEQAVRAIGVELDSKCADELSRWHQRLVEAREDLSGLICRVAEKRPRAKGKEKVEPPA